MSPPQQVLATEETTADKAKYGRLYGNITTNKYGVTGRVYAVDHSKLFIKGFSYDNKGVDAFFFIENRGNTGAYVQIDYPAGAKNE
jgi:Electron transfer DM13